MSCAGESRLAEIAKTAYIEDGLAVMLKRCDERFRVSSIYLSLSAAPPANAHLRWNRISAKGAFFLYLTAERNVAITTILCQVSPEQYPDLALPAIRLHKEIECDSFIADLHRRPG